MYRKVSTLLPEMLDENLRKPLNWVKRRNPSLTGDDGFVR